MAKFIVLVVSTIFSGIGWWLGAHVGIFTAFALSMVGTGIGMYYGRQWAHDYLP